MKPRTLTDKYPLSIRCWGDNFDKLAAELVKLRYDQISDLLDNLASLVHARATSMTRGSAKRESLCQTLEDLAQRLELASVSAELAEAICRPAEKEEEEE